MCSRLPVVVPVVGAPCSLSRIARLVLGPRRLHATHLNMRDIARLQSNRTPSTESERDVISECHQQPLVEGCQCAGGLTQSQFLPLPPTPSQSSTPFAAARGGAVLYVQPDRAVNIGCGDAGSY